jgi:ABC-type polysaccharide/polyol phosphate export permease
LRAFWILVKLRLAELGRRPALGFFVLALPLVFLLVVGGMFANGHPFERRRVSLTSPDLPAEAVAHLPGIRVVRERDERAARGSLESRMTDAVLVPAVTGPPRLLVRPDDELFGRGLAAALGGAPLEIVPAPRWGYLHYLFPGMLVLTVVLTGLYGMGHAMVRYRATQFLKKLSTTPLPRSTFVGAQLAARAVMALAQALIMAIGAHLVFGLPLTPAALAWLLSLTTLGILTFMGAGFALACAVEVESSMQDVINSISAPLVLLSEVFFSADELPGPLPAIASALPSTQLVRLSRAVLLQGETRVSALLPGIGVVTVWLLATFVVSLAVFRWND